MLWRRVAGPPQIKASLNPPVCGALHQTERYRWVVIRGPAYRRRFGAEPPRQPFRQRRGRSCAATVLPKNLAPEKAGCPVSFKMIALERNIDRATQIEPVFADVIIAKRYVVELKSWYRC